MLSEESVKEMKNGLQDLITYHDDHAKDENGNIIDEECYRIANIIDNAFYYIEQLETEKQNLIDKLERDTVNITKTLKDGKHCDDYSRCRLKAYRTKTKEILKIAKGEKDE